MIFELVIKIMNERINIRDSLVFVILSVFYYLFDQFINMLLNCFARLCIL